MTTSAVFFFHFNSMQLTLKKVCLQKKVHTKRILSADQLPVVVFPSDQPAKIVIKKANLFKPVVYDVFVFTTELVPF